MRPSAFRGIQNIVTRKCRATNCCPSPVSPVSPAFPKPPTKPAAASLQATPAILARRMHGARTPRRRPVAVRAQVPPLASRAVCGAASSARGSPCYSDECGAPPGVDGAGAQRGQSAWQGRGKPGLGRSASCYRPSCQVRTSHGLGAPDIPGPSTCRGPSCKEQVSREGGRSGGQRTCRRGERVGSVGWGRPPAVRSCGEGRPPRGEVPRPRGGKWGPRLLSPLSTPRSGDLGGHVAGAVEDDGHLVELPGFLCGDKLLEEEAYGVLRLSQLTPVGHAGGAIDAAVDFLTCSSMAVLLTGVRGDSGRVPCG